MAKTKPKPRRSQAARTSSPSLTALAQRVKALETDFSAMRGDMSNLSEDVSALRTTIKLEDERSQRGETLMVSMQTEQRRMSKAVDRIAEALKVGQGSAAEVAQSAETQAADEAEALADAPDEDVEDGPPA